MMELLAPVHFGETLARIVPRLPRLGEVGSPSGSGRSVVRAGRRLTASSGSSASLASALRGSEPVEEHGLTGPSSALPSLDAGYVARCYLEQQLAFVVPKFSFLV